MMHADQKQPSLWRETFNVCNATCSSHGGDHSRGAYLSQFDTVNSYTALNTGSYTNAAQKVSASSKCAPPYNYLFLAQYLNFPQCTLYYT